MITTRKKYVRHTKNYFRELEEKYGEIPENHRKAIELRMDFFKTYVLHRVNKLINFILFYYMNIFKLSLFYFLN